MPTIAPAAATNRLIAMLPSKTRARVLARCDDTELVFGDPLGEPGIPITHVYFPTSGFISLLTPGSGETLEVGLIGFEGMHGISLVLEVDVSPFRSLVQGAGTALRMDAAAFKGEHARSPALRQALNRYVYVLMTQLARSGPCMHFHRVEARLARWLLMTQDRSRSDRFRITHTFLAWMLGVRRASISDAAHALAARKLIVYKRGELTVLSRRGLEAAACGCYQLDVSLYRQVLESAPAPVSRIDAAS